MVIRKLLGLALLLAAAAPARAEAPDRLAVEYGTLPAFWGPRLSPDGSKISFLQMHPEDLPILRVLDTATGEVSIALASVPGKADISWCDWVNDERLFCGYRGIAREFHQSYAVSRAVAVNADGSDAEVMFENRREGGGQQQDQIIDWLPDDPRHVLIEVAGAKGSGVSRLDVVSGRLSRVKRTRPGVRHFLSDGRGTVRLYWYMTERRERWHYRAAGSEDWKVLHEADIADLESSYTPVGFGAGPDALLVVKPFGGRLALFERGLGEDGQERLVYAHPEVDVMGPLVLGKFRRVVAIGYATDRPHLHFFDERIAQITERIGALFPGRSVWVVDESWDQNTYLVRVESDRDPGTYHRYDVRKNELARLARQYPLLAERDLAPMKPIHYTARDGARVPAYLTLPPDAAPGPLSLVVLPHGGPQARDYWGFDWIAQYLAARGHAVLQSNYRGSAGYGGDWVGAGGFQAWRLAISDITDGTRHLVEQGLVDPARVCVVGWSYGGYAALMSAVEEPERYRCVVAIAAVTDPRELIRDFQHYLNARAVREFIGTEEEVTKQGSPLRRAGEIRAPVLLFHGDEDVNVPVDHSRKLAKALKRKRRSVEYVEYEDVEHDIARNGYRIDMLTRIGAFLDEHIGQRDTPGGDGESASTEPALPSPDG